MIGFWVAAAVLTASAAALMLRGAAAAAMLTGDPQVEAHRQAVRDIDQLADRDLLAPDEHRQLRAEAARRLIGAADRPEPPPGAQGGPLVPLLAAAGVAVMALVLYAVVGTPGAPDQPFARRLTEWEARPETAPPAALAATLEAVADQRPTDPVPLRKLAALDLGLGDVDGAAHALRRAMLLQPADADLAAMLGEVKVLQGGGAVTPDARALFQRAIRLDPRQAAARYYLARAALADGDVAGGLASWRALLTDLQAGDPRRDSLSEDIAATERAGRLAEPASVATPSAAPAVSPMIRGMVDGLAARLAAKPDDPQGWVRLVRAYAVLGDTAARDRTLAAARARYAGDGAELAALAHSAQAQPMGAR
jgi:cytochrome c-type biogenesis protein CcmH